MTEKQLIKFAERVRKRFEAGKIKGPIHLPVGSEKEVIKVFKKIKDSDWVFSTHRNMYHALLKGIPVKELWGDICDGKCMHVYSKRYRFCSSAIVGGCLPIAVGLALGLKRQGRKGHVWCFTGDGGTDSGRFFEAAEYGELWELPITFVIEDNNMSVDTPMEARWNCGGNDTSIFSNVVVYKYKRKFPHTGSGKWVTF